jgi:hypothetical protein
VTALTIKRLVHAVTEYSLEQINDGYRDMLEGRPHHIEVFDAPEMHFCIFFDQPTPADIGYRASASAYSREVLAAAFDTHIDDLPNFPFTNEDPLIVNRSNPLDAHALGERTMAS